MMEQNQTITMPRLGEAAPAFTAVTTQGVINFPSDYKGQWKILFSHPADFTPVCTSEFMTFGHLAAELSTCRTICRWIAEPHCMASYHRRED